MLEKYDTINGTVVGDSLSSRSIISNDGSAQRMRCSVPLLVGATGLFTVTGYIINDDGITYRVEPDSIDYGIA